MATNGSTTTEYERAKSSGTWGVVAMLIGALITIGSAVAPSLGGKWATIVGGFIAILGIIQKLLADLGYISSRTAVKTAEAASEYDPIGSSNG